MIKSELFQDPEVFITVCSVAGQAKFGKHMMNLDRRLEINWNNFKDQKNGDLVGLFDFNVEKELKDKSKCIVELAKESVSVTAPRGSHKTSVRHDRRQLNVKCDRNLGWWVGYLRFQAGSWVVVKSNSFKIYPTWMREMKDVIGDIPLHSLMIPGSHDAGSWMEYEPSNCENIYVRYYICQEDSIYEQLMHGIRYLDVRVAYYPDTQEKFWVNHDKYRVGPLILLLKDVKKFIEETKEVIFLDFHSFPIGFNSQQEIHEELIKLVMGEIGRHLLPKTFPTSVTPNMAWKANRTIIWTYANDAMNSLEDNKYLWPYLVHAWGNKRKPEHLEKYISEAIEKYFGKGVFWSAMAELTPKPIDYISKPKYGLRGFAEWVNLPLTYWFQNKEWYSRCNIVSTDFYLGNNLIEMSVAVNRQKVLEQ